MFSLQRSDRSPSNVPMTSVSTLTTSLATSTGSVTTVSLNLRLAATVLPSTLLTPNTWLRTATTSTTLSAARGHSLVRNSNYFSTYYWYAVPDDSSFKRHNIWYNKIFYHYRKCSIKMFSISKQKMKTENTIPTDLNKKYHPILPNTI